VSLFQLAVTTGILVAYIVDRALAPAHAWRWMLGLAFIPGALLVLGMIPMPESPRWLLKTGAEKAARQVLSMLRRPDEIEAELHEVRDDLECNLPATTATAPPRCSPRSTCSMARLSLNAGRGIDIKSSWAFSITLTTRFPPSSPCS
jgi:MFS family permease